MYGYLVICKVCMYLFVIVVRCVSCLFGCMVDLYCLWKVHKTSVCTFAFRLLPLGLALLFGSYPSIQYCNSNFLQTLNRTFKSTKVYNVDSLFVWYI